MKMILKIATIAMLGAALSASVMAQSAGEKSYGDNHCATCHKADGSGNAGMKIPAFSAKATDADRTAAIKNGKAGAGPVKMKGYALPDAEITALVKYVKTLAK